MYSCGLFLLIFYGHNVQWTDRYLQSLYYKRYRPIVHIARVLSPRDIVLFGKWNSVRVRFIFGHYILKAKSNFTL